MKKIVILIPLLLTAFLTVACSVCERQQPKILRGITHGAGPESKWDYLIVWATVVIVGFTLFFSVKWLARPGEKSDQHIKRFILNNE
jgi:choline-glycine betaine transporter